MLVRAPEKVPFDPYLLYLPAVADACSRLRRSMYEAGGRAWYNAFVRLAPNGTLTPTYDYEGPPFLHWGAREVELARHDQELYPRDPGQLPAWHPSR